MRHLLMERTLFGPSVLRTSRKAARICCLFYRNPANDEGIYGVTPQAFFECFFFSIHCDPLLSSCPYVLAEKWRYR